MSLFKRIVKKLQQQVPRQEAIPVQMVVHHEDRQQIIQTRTTLTVLQACRENDIDIEHFCGGTASCGTCFIKVLQNPENLSPVQPREEMVLGYSKSQMGFRLSCQAKILGESQIEILNS